MTQGGPLPVCQFEPREIGVLDLLLNLAVVQAQKTIFIALVLRFPQAPKSKKDLPRSCRYWVDRFLCKRPATQNMLNTSQLALLFDLVPRSFED